MSFDLNIQNYTIQELTEMFELPQKYDKEILDIKEEKITKSIINNNDINNETKQNTIQFLVKAKNILLNNISEKENNFMDKMSQLYHFNYDLGKTKLEENYQHQIQARDKKPYVSSSPARFFEGVINPISKRTIVKVLNIDTRFRENYYSSPASNFNLQLPLNINNVLEMQLASLELPLSFFTISKQYNNNYFHVTANGVSKLVEIPNGNYNWTGIQEAINYALDLLGGDFQYINFLINEVADNGTAQMMVGLDGTEPAPFDFELNFQLDRNGNEDRGTPLPLKLGWILGFRNGAYINNKNYVSEGIVDVSGPRYLYLVVDDFNKNVNDTFIAAFNSSILNKNILARISINSPTFTVYSQNNFNVVTIPREYFGPVNINALNIQLLDEYGRIIDLNNMDYSFSLNMTIVYDI
jgi:hypothetical protein